MLIAAVTVSDIIALCAVIGAGISITSLIVGWSRDRDKQRKANTAAVAELTERLDDLFVTLFGRRTGDQGFPEVEGFFQIIERRLTELEQAITERE